MLGVVKGKEIDRNSGNTNLSYVGALAHLLSRATITAKIGKLNGRTGLLCCQRSEEEVETLEPSIVHNLQTGNNHSSTSLANSFSVASFLRK